MMLHKGLQQLGSRGVLQLLVSPSQKRNFFFWGRRHPYWGLVDVSRQMEDMNNAFARMERDMTAAFRNPSWFGRSSSFPSSNPHLIERDGKVVVKMDLGKDFNPDNVKVSLKDRVLTIQAKHEVKSEDGKSRTYQEFVRSFTLPENVKVEEVKSLFTPSGELLVEAPQVQVSQPKPKEIPVTFESSANKAGKPDGSKA